jgi:glutamine cyclotransferase
MKFKFTLLTLIVVISSCKNNPKTEETPAVVEAPTIPVITYTIKKTFPHDTTSFTEGFLFHNNNLYESTGASQGLPQSRSLFGIVDTLTGRIKVKVEIDRDKYFGEGITFLNGKVYQLTYQTKVGFIYDEKTFKRIGEFTIPSAEGWGMTTDGKNLIMSDGTNLLTYLDPNTMQIAKTVAVSENGYAKDYLNELEYIDGYFFANIWTTNTIVKIDPASGFIVGTMDMTQIANDAKSIFTGSMEMNGIAFEPNSKRIFVTGKMWPKMYEIMLRN